MTLTLDGPFAVFALDATGAETADLAPGVHYKTTTADLAANSALQPYVVTPSHPLQSVWAGDQPETPTWTVSLRFPDQATADAVLARLAGA